jgi:hypothetical protein
LEVLIAAGLALALEIDTAQEADDKGHTKSCASAVSALQRLVAELVVKGRHASSGEVEAEGDWCKPGAVADLAKVRDAKKPRAGDVGSRGGRGGKAVAQAVDAVAATRSRRRA